MTITNGQARSVVHNRGHVRSIDGHDLGEVVDFLVDEETGQILFCTVDRTNGAGRDGQTGQSTSLVVAVHEAVLYHGQVLVPHRHSFITAAPTVPDALRLSGEDEDRLFRYYGIPVDDFSLVATQDGTRGPDHHDRQES